MVDIVKDILGEGWFFEEDDIWIFCYSPENEQPDQGWKIHISATVLNAEEILKKAVPIIKRFAVNFKFAKDKRILAFLNSRMMNRGSSGKFITIYPPEKKFKPLIEELYLELKDFKGPYILSDMRYKDSGVVYYRYGGFVKNERVDITGEKIPIIFDPNGNPYDDIRTPFYNPPPWVEDPFGNPRIAGPRGDLILNQRYKVLGVIQFSNNGGVYRALDTKTNTPVIVKEARPYVSMWENGLDAQDLLKKEYRILKKLEGERIAPRPIEIFQEWEHLFLVEEFINGISLRGFVAYHSPILNPLSTYDNFREYLYKILRVLENLARGLETLHRKGIIFGDLSMNNIIIDSDLNAFFIDFEGAYEVGSEKWISIWTPGFASKNLMDGNRPTFQDDYYAFGELIYTLLFSNNHLFFKFPELREKFVKEVLEGYGYDETFIWVIKKNLKKPLKPLASVKILKCSNGKIQRVKTVKNCDVSKLTEGIYMGIISSANLKGVRLFESYKDNLGPLNFCYGDIGILVILNRWGYEIPEDFINKILTYPLKDYPPGLYVGYSGICWGFLELGFMDIAEHALKLAKNNQDIWKYYDMFYGLSGYGMANLKFYKESGDRFYLEEAIKCAEIIIKNSHKDDEVRYIYGYDGDIHYGFAFGASGISLFFIKLYDFLRDKKFLRVAKEFLKFDLKNSVDAGGYLSFFPDKKRPTILPYVRHGSAGILGVAIRFWDRTKDEEIFQYIKNILPDLNRKYTIFPGQLFGLAGIGETLIDMYNFGISGEINKIVEGLFMFAIERENKVFYPSEEYEKISFDWGSGSAGILDFLKRYQNPKNPRTLWEI